MPVVDVLARVVLAVAPLAVKARVMVVANTVVHRVEAIVLVALTVAIATNRHRQAAQHRHRIRNGPRRVVRNSTVAADHRRDARASNQMLNNKLVGKMAGTMRGVVVAVAMMVVAASNARLSSTNHA